MDHRSSRSGVRTVKSGMKFVDRSAQIGENEGSEHGRRAHAQRQLIKRLACNAIHNNG